MKKIYSLLAVLAIAVSSNAQTVVLTETFPYADATSLTTNNATTGWFQHSGTQGQITVTGGVANIAAGQTEDINKSIGTPYAMGTAGTQYQVDFTADINVLNATGLTTAGDYFMSLGGTTTTTNGTGGITALPARLYVKAGTTGYLLGVLNNSGGTVTPTYSTTEIPYGTVMSITLSYININGGSQTATLQIPGQPLLTNSTGTQAASANIASITIRQGGSATSGTGNIAIDNIVVTTYSPVLGVSDITSVKSNFVKNTLVKDEINFGSKADVKIYNMNGQVVRTASVSENKNLEVSDLAPGMYIVTGTVNGEAVSQKILKK